MPSPKDLSVDKRISPSCMTHLVKLKQNLGAYLQIGPLANINLFSKHFIESAIFSILGDMMTNGT